jgi:hypothetical protein
VCNQKILFGQAVCTGCKVWRVSAYGGIEFLWRLRVTLWLQNAAPILPANGLLLKLTYGPFALPPRHLMPLHKGCFATYLAPSCTHTHTEQRVSKNWLMPSGRVISSLACITASASISFLARNIVGLRNIERASYIHFRLLVCIGYMEPELHWFCLLAICDSEEDCFFSRG